jgi:hypothetical protein
MRRLLKQKSARRRDIFSLSGHFKTKDMEGHKTGIGFVTPKIDLACCPTFPASGDVFEI